MKKTKTVIGLIHPTDAYYEREAKLRGREVASHNLKAWRDGWFHGNVTFPNGKAQCFYKVRLREERIK